MNEFTIFCKLIKSIALTAMLLLLSYLGLKSVLLILIVIQQKS